MYRINNAKKLLPSIFTLGNLLCGFLAVINVIEGSLTHAAWWIIIAAIFDALDGKIARLTGCASEFGIELDSLADVISFGIAPAVLFHSYAFVGTGNLGYFLAFCFVASGTIRLARFNVTATKHKKSYFTGMPIPAAASILASFILFSEHVWNVFAKIDFSIGLIIFTSFAMLSTLKYSTFPKIGFNNKSDILRSIWFISHVLLIAAYPDEVCFPTGILYLLSGPVKLLFVPAFQHMFQKVNSR